MGDLLLLSSAMCSGLAAWWNQVIIRDISLDKKFFKSVSSYYRMDTPLQEMTALNIYPKTPNLTSDIWNIRGVVSFDMVFPLSEERTEMRQRITNTLSYVQGQMLTQGFLGEIAQSYVSRLYVPGLIQILQNTSPSLNTYKDMITKAKNGAVTITVDYSYMINVYLNQLGMQEQGYDLMSPLDVIYMPITDVDTTIEIKQ